MKSFVKSTKRWGLYVHSPFCVHKCGYCDFNSWGETSREPQERWLAAILRQARYWRDQIPSDVVFDTFFWGGGTPSLVDDRLAERFLSEVNEIFAWAPGAERSLEVNPETLNQDKLRLWEGLGINRLSIGIQSFEDAQLERLERHARRRDNLLALEMLASHWRGRWSMDLMFALPQQSLSDWERELELALSFAPQHLSAYQLTLTTARSKHWEQAPNDILLEFFDRTEALLSERGLNRYEVSNFSRPGEECRHNLKYWRVESFLGLGPGAAGLVNDLTENPLWGFHQKSPDAFDLWSSHAGSELFEQKSLQARSPDDDLHERLMMGLRLAEGLPLDSLPARVREALPAHLGEATFRGRLEIGPADRLRATPEGLRLLDTLLVKLFRALETTPDTQQSAT